VSVSVLFIGIESTHDFAWEVGFRRTVRSASEEASRLLLRMALSSSPDAS
jgi:hypothetical protein